MADNISSISSSAIPFRVDGRIIGDNHPTYIIAEIGINHNGDVDLALKMVEAAARAGADAVKFQIVDAEKSYTKDSESYKIFKGLELSFSDWERVAEKARILSIDVFASFHTVPEDLVFVERLAFPVIKLSSGNLTNIPLLKAVAASGKPIILSTGLSYLSEVDESVRCLEQNGASQIGILHCTSLYPTPPTEVNLLAIRTLKHAFPRHIVGFSDHTDGIHCSLVAVALGARIIEKHFTLDRTLPGPDHAFSSTLQELAILVNGIREVESAMGDGEKKPAPQELSLRVKYRRGIVAARDIAEGELINPGHLSIKRCNSECLETKYYTLLLGRCVRTNILKDTPITLNMV